MIIGIPIWVGRKLYARFKTTSKHKRNILISSGVAASVSIFSVILFVSTRAWDTISFPRISRCTKSNQAENMES